MKRLAVISLCTLLAAVACREVPTYSGSDFEYPAMAIYDGSNGGNEGFCFLQPIVTHPSCTGIFDGSHSPIVRILEVADGAIVGSCPKPGGKPELPIDPALADAFVRSARR